MYIELDEQYLDVLYKKLEQLFVMETFQDSIYLYTVYRYADWREHCLVILTAINPRFDWEKL